MTAPRPAFTYPGVYGTYFAAPLRVIVAATTSSTAFVGLLNPPTGSTAPAVGVATSYSSWAEFTADYGPLVAMGQQAADATVTALAVWQFFLNGGGTAWVVALGTTTGVSTVDQYETQLNQQLADGAALDRIAPAEFNLLCLPDLGFASSTVQASVLSTALGFCNDRNAFLLLDAPPPKSAIEQWKAAATWSTTTIDAVGVTVVPEGVERGDEAFTKWLTAVVGGVTTADGDPNPLVNGAVYYPWLVIPDPTNSKNTLTVPPSGSVAGVYARTDSARGVWKAPAGVDAGVSGVTALADPTINDTANGQLNVMAVNCLRVFPQRGPIVWGARTLAGAPKDGTESAFTYIPVRRLTDFIEASLVQSLKWAVFEPNDPTLWSTISLEVGAFMGGLYAQGAFLGATAAAAYQVVCDATTNTSDDMMQGVVTVLVGFQPVEPVEFVWVNVQVDTLPTAS